MQETVPGKRRGIPYRVGVSFFLRKYSARRVPFCIPYGIRYRRSQAVAELTVEPFMS